MLDRWVKGGGGVWALHFGGRRELVKGKCWGGREREVGEGRSLVGGRDGR